MMAPGQAGQGGSGATPAPSYDPRVMAAASARLRTSQSPPAQASDGGDTEALRQQMQSQRAVQQSYQTQVPQVSGGGGGADYGQDLARQHAMAMQAFQQRMKFYSRMSQMSPQAASRAAMAQAMENAGQDPDDMRDLWAQQDQGAGQ